MGEGKAQDNHLAFSEIRLFHIVLPSQHLRTHSLLIGITSILVKALGKEQ